jgi:hypothetical protein
MAAAGAGAGAGGGVAVIAVPAAGAGAGAGAASGAAAGGGAACAVVAGAASGAGVLLQPPTRSKPPKERTAANRYAAWFEIFEMEDACIFINNSLSAKVSALPWFTAVGFTVLLTESWFKYLGARISELDCYRGSSHWMAVDGSRFRVEMN